MSMEGTILDRLARVPALTASENKLARYLENNFPQAALANLEEMSARNAVSKATVSRFIKRLGFGDYRDFSRALKEEVAGNFDLPLHRVAKRQHADISPGEVLRGHYAMGERTLRTSLEHLDEVAFQNVLDAICNPARELYLMSVATSRALLNYFYLLSKFHRGNVRMLNETDRLAHELVDVPSSAVLMTASIDHHPPLTMAVLRHFHSLGCETIFITNRRKSPLLRYVKHPLFVHTEGDITFTSRISTIAMLEALLAGMEARLQSGIGRRYKEIERLRGDFTVGNRS